MTTEKPPKILPRETRAAKENLSDYCRKYLNVSFCAQSSALKSPLDRMYSFYYEHVTVVVSHMSVSQIEWTHILAQPDLCGLSLHLLYSTTARVIGGLELEIG